MTTSGTRHRTTWARVATTWLAATNAVAALAGAGAVVAGVIDFGPEVTARLPLESPGLAGLCLGVFVGLPNLALAILAFARHPLAEPGSVLVGAGMVAWIGVQVAVIREPSFFHPFYAAVGLVMVIAGLSRPRQP